MNTNLVLAAGGSFADNGAHIIVFTVLLLLAFVALFFFVAFEGKTDNVKKSLKKFSKNNKTKEDQASSQWCDLRGDWERDQKLEERLNLPKQLALAEKNDKN